MALLGTYLAADAVRQVAAALSRLTPEALAQNFNGKDMESKNIYPEVMWVREGAEALDYVLDNYQQLQVFYLDAAARGDAVIQWLS